MTADWLPRGAQVSDESWRARHRILTWALWLEVPALLLIGLIGPMGTAEALLLPMVVALAGVAGRLLTSRSVRATVTGLGLIAGSFIGIELSGGQVHAHLFILSAIALVALYQQWAPLLLTVGAVVVHHLTLGLMAPERVFSMTSMTVGHAMPMTESLPFVQVLTMVVVHAVAVIVEVVGILMLWHFAEQAERESEQVRAQAETERQAAESARLAAAEAEVVSERHRLAENARSRDNVTAEAHLIQGRVEDASSAVAHLEEQAAQLRGAVREVSERCQQAAETAGDGEKTAATAAEEVRRLERAMGEISEVNQMIAQLAPRRTCSA